MKLYEVYSHANFYTCDSYLVSKFHVIFVAGNIHEAHDYLLSLRSFFYTAKDYNISYAFCLGFSIHKSCFLFYALHTDGILINMVVGGEVVTLKSIEETSGLVIAEMPINVSVLLSLCSSYVLDE